MKELKKKHFIANIIGLIAVIALGVCITVFSGQIYDSLSKITFLSQEEEEEQEPVEEGKKWNISYGNYVPGTYTATVYGFESDITATVEVSETEILSITMNASGESNIGRDAVKAIKEAILESQSAEDVDAVSGATYSSNAALEAVKDALQQASK